MNIWKSLMCQPTCDREHSHPMYHSKDHSAEEGEEVVPSLWERNGRWEEINENPLLRALHPTPDVSFCEERHLLGRSAQPFSSLWLIYCWKKRVAFLSGKSPFGRRNQPFLLLLLESGSWEELVLWLVLCQTVRLAVTALLLWEDLMFPNTVWTCVDWLTGVQLWAAHYNCTSKLYLPVES